VRSTSAAEQPLRITLGRGDGPPVDAWSVNRVVAFGAKNGETIVFEAVAIVVADDHDDRA
jgi:phosphotransferase system HPr-like phosphotransfer protein